MNGKYDEIDHLVIYKGLNRLKQSELGEKLGLSQSMLSLILSRKHRASDEVMSKIKEITRELHI
ncbi:helix-turn-helix domain-containing protein [Halobacillus andaensis]|uniref:helix-turn-helix domain-containing protein n=1 Tax=Halobacillus andaensis TaxID=1176239 RepID=UPI003D74F3B3